MCGQWQAKNTTPRGGRGSVSPFGCALKSVAILHNTSYIISFGLCGEAVAERLLYNSYYVKIAWGGFYGDPS